MIINDLNDEHDKTGIVLKTIPVNEKSAKQVLSRRDFTLIAR
jgi:hypothetical protein